MLYIKIVQLFIRNTLGNTQRGLVFLKLKIFVFWKRFFHFFAFFIIYNLKNSYFICEIFRKFQQNHFSCYSKGIGVLKFANFHLLETLFQFYLPFSPFTMEMTQMLYINFFQHFKRNTLGNTQQGLVFLNLKVFIFWKHFFQFFIVYNLNNSYFI